MTPLNRRRWANFRANRRGCYSLWIFIFLFGLSLLAEFIANDKPLVVYFDGEVLSPVLVRYTEQRFGGDFPTEVDDYRKKDITRLIESKGFMVWPPIRFTYDKKVSRVLMPPSAANWLGTDVSGHDVLARLIYGFRVSVLFGLLLTALSMVIGVSAGAVQGYYGGRLDLSFQRLLEIWSSLPTLYLLIILATVVKLGFWWLLGILVMFSWTGYVAVVRAEFLRARNFDFVRAARALGVSNPVIMFRHVLPNAMVATIAYLPFNLCGSITVLAMLDLLGLGLKDLPTLGGMLNQASENHHATWLGITGFLSLGTVLILLIFIGEAVRDAFDPRKTLGTGRNDLSRR